MYKYSAQFLVETNKRLFIYYLFIIIELVLGHLVINVDMATPGGKKDPG